MLVHNALKVLGRQMWLHICLKKMKEKESKLLEQEKLMHTSDIPQCALFKDTVRLWLETKGQSKLFSALSFFMYIIFII